MRTMVNEKSSTFIGERRGRRMLTRAGRALTLFSCGLVVAATVVGCQTPGGHSASGRLFGKRSANPIRRVICVYDQKPWLNLDVMGDRDPEGIRYRVFLDPGDGNGVHRDGTLHVEMYQIDRVRKGEVQRTLVSDWHYPTSEVHTIAKPGMLGDGYYLYLRWARKDIPGHEVEIVTRFEDEHGRLAKSGTKRFRVPKYSS